MITRSDLEFAVEVLSDCRDKLCERMDKNKVGLSSAVNMGVLTNGEADERVKEEQRKINAFKTAIDILNERIASVSGENYIYNEEYEPESTSYKCPNCGTVYTRKPLLVCYKGCKRRVN